MKTIHSPWASSREVSQDSFAESKRPSAGEETVHFPLRRPRKTVPPWGRHYQCRLATRWVTYRRLIDQPADFRVQVSFAA